MSMSAPAPFPGLFYFYSTQEDYCSGRDYTFKAEDNTENGDLCLVAPVPVRGIYACPAGDEYCWTDKASITTSDDKTTPKDCDGGWTCYNWEECSTDEKKPCMFNGDTIRNPIQSLNPADAKDIAQSVLSASITGLLTAVPLSTSVSATTATATTNLAVNSAASSAATLSFTNALSALAGDATSTANSSDGSSSDGTSTSSTGRSTGTASTSGSAAGASSTASLHDETPIGSSKLSSGAIAGIAVGAAAVAILLALIAFLMFRRRKKRSRALVAAREQSIDDDDEHEKLSSHHGVMPVPAPVPQSREIPTDDPPLYAAAVAPGPPPRSAGGLSTRSAVSALSAVSAVSPVMSPIDATPSPVQEPPSPMAGVHKGPSHLVAETSPQSPERPVSPLQATETHTAAEGESLMPLEESPLQKLMTHGKYPPDR